MKINRSLICWLSYALIASLLFSLYSFINNFPFYYDQARDAFEAYSIWHNRDFKILGPSSDIPGVNHGVIWYYLLALPYMIGRGDPVFSGFCSLAISLLTIPFLFYITKRIYDDDRMPFVVSGLYALSPLFVSFSSWMSNPLMALYISPLLLYSLWSYIQKPKAKTALFIGILLGLVIHTNFAYGVIILTAPFYYWVYKKQIRLKDTAAAFLGLMVMITPFIIAQYKFGSLYKNLTEYIIYNLTYPDKPPLTEKLFNFIVRFFNLISLSTIAQFEIVTLVFIAVFFYLFWKKKHFGEKQFIFLLLYISHLLIFGLINPSLLTNIPLTALSFSALVILISDALTKIFKKPNLIIVLWAISVIQTAVIIKWLKSNYSPVYIQRGMTLPIEKKIIDYTYKESKDKPFIIVTITNPLYINTTWSYLYEFYGQPKYGYLPFWGGKDQTEYLGNLKKQESGDFDRYLIFESPAGIADVWIAKSIYDEDKLSDVLNEYTAGALKVQKRKFHPDKPLPATPSALLTYPSLWGN